MPRPPLESDDNKMRLMIACGTRPEAIKMAPLVTTLKTRPEFDVSLCVTGQHRQMLTQVLELFELVPDHDLSVMKSGQDLTDVTAAILTGMRGVFGEQRPDRVLVHGDTNTTLSVSLAAYYAKVPVSHVEAGLRTGDIYSPWPEEANRRLTSVIADRHYAPTPVSRENLVGEGVNPDAVIVTGNTVIDALLMIEQRLREDLALRATMAEQFSLLDESRRLILVTGHRRENFGEGFENICKALAELAQRDDVQIVYPVHLNPEVQRPVKKHLGGLERVHLLEPLDYLPFVYLMSRAHIIITDSGGIQEEAPSLGKPVLVMRDTTERPEALTAGTVQLVGTERRRIVRAAIQLLDNQTHYNKMSLTSNPYGDGKACERIVADLIR